MKRIWVLFSITISLSTHAQTVEDLRTYFQTSIAAQNFLKTVYQNRGFEPIFSRNGQWLLSSSDLVQIEKSIRTQGLSSGDYSLKHIQEMLKNSGDLKSEIFIADNIFKSIVHTVTGRVDPRTVASDIKYVPKPFTQTTIFSTIKANEIAGLYDKVAPKNKIYIGLQNALSRLAELEAKNLWVNITPVAVSAGSSHPTVTEIKQKLKLIGYTFQNEESIFDAEFGATLDKIAQELSVPAEKNLTTTSKVWRVINADIRSRVRETELQMEKVRWLPDELESRHAIANIGNQMFYVQDLELNPQQLVFNFKAINGSISRKTPTMKDKVQSVILNPTWTVTMNIFFNDKLPLIKKDPSYLKRNGFRVVSLKTDQEIDPSTINWKNVTRQNIDFQVVQKPSYNNALGIVKFPMTNQYSIYLHDTGDRHLFKNNYRLLSSGCVRLEKPLDLAEYLLANTTWNRSRIDSTVAKPGQSIESPTGIRLAKPLTIYIVNLTVNQDDQRIQFFDDYYGHNSQLYKKLLALGFLKN
ncbi:MAG: L,D-transpeptidase family protein [Bdellovibrionaceae bacterium]|nr:L,D-transpeptidase family protein [Pseudobdellovibrionaceae bacterium]